MSVKTYKSTDDVQLAPHFTLQEFKCQCGQQHDTLVSDELVQKLEALRSALDCKSIVITSGYRCLAHDAAVSTGRGQHTKGLAADICCYGKDGKPISSKLVCCTAQDLGFTGIANITSSYDCTHVDVRLSGTWYGDEVHGNGNVTDDFYNYYGIIRNDSRKILVKGIDVSYSQGNINWSHVKADGVKFALIRAGYGRESSQKDSQFENNYAGCKSNGIPCGAYWYSYAKSAEEAKQEAKVFLQVIKGKSFEYPVYIDLEEKSQFALGKKICSDIVQAFCDVMENAGYYAGLYCSTSYLDSHISDSIKNRYAIWVAQYNDKCTYTGDYGIWQHSVAGHPEHDYVRAGKVYGVDGQCDLDYAYVDYPYIIKAAGLNGFSKSDIKSDSEESAPEKSTLEKILDHVASIDEKLN